MIRVAGFILKFAIFVALAVWLADQTGAAHIVWGDYIVDMPVAALAVGGLALGLAFYLVFRLAHLVKHGPHYWRTNRKLKKLRHGHALLTAGMTAVAAGDAAEAGRLAVAARKTLGVTTMTQLLQAQAAQLAGDDLIARAIFTALTRSGESMVLGYRGLITLEQRDGNWTEVETLVNRLYQLRPATPWLGLARFDVMVRQGNWAEANVMLAQAATARLQNADNIRQHRAALLTALSQDSSRAGRKDTALQFAEKAVRQHPGWLPAILQLAQCQSDSGHLRAARRTVSRHWATCAHPHLAAIYRADAEPLDAYKQIERLCRANPDHAASLQTLGEAALAASLWGEARRYLLILVERGPATKAAYRLLATLERREHGNEAASQTWLARAADAPDDASWICVACGHTHSVWQAVCIQCASFGSISWQNHHRTYHPKRLSAQANDSLPRLGWDGRSAS